MMIQKKSVDYSGIVEVCHIIHLMFFSVAQEARQLYISQTLAIVFVVILRRFGRKTNFLYLKKTQTKNRKSD